MRMSFPKKPPPRQGFPSIRPRTEPSDEALTLEALTALADKIGVMADAMASALTPPARGLAREEVYAAIDSERDYQERFVIPNPTRSEQTSKDHSVGDFLVMAATYLRTAERHWVHSAGDEQALGAIRTVAGILVQAMELHGAPHRRPDFDDLEPPHA